MFDNTTSARERLKARIAELWARGLRVDDIAADCDVTRNVVVGLRKRMGLPERGSPIKTQHPRDGSIWTPERHAQIKAMVTAGASWAVIGKEIGCADTTARDYALARGWTKQPAAPVSRAPTQRREERGAPVAIPVRALASSGCRWPMWGDRERATHVYCEAPVIALIGEDGIARPCSYCREHRRKNVTKTVLRVAA